VSNADKAAEELAALQAMIDKVEISLTAAGGNVALAQTDFATSQAPLDRVITQAMEHQRPT